jgi:hypothetical protein
MKILILLLAPLISASQIVYLHGSKILPEENATRYRKLMWGDFKGPQTDPNSLAISTTGWFYTETFDEPNCRFDVFTWFNQQESFCTTRDPYVLKHEQGHLDIAEIFCRHLQQELNKINLAKDTLIGRALFQEWTNRRQEMQDLYDKETNRALNHIAQERWNIWIKEQLVLTNK